LKKTPKHKKHQTPNNNTNKKTHKKQKNTTPNQTTTSKPTELLGAQWYTNFLNRYYNLLKKSFVYPCAPLSAPMKNF
ncbi:hypothetical protein CUJ83_14555, partial [Methanocella sp. CWC-04]